MNARLLFMMLVLLMGSSGCAFTYGKEGERGIIGLVWVEFVDLKKEKTGQGVRGGKLEKSFIPPAIQERSIGVYIDLSGQSAGLGVGYRNILTVSPIDDAESKFYYNSRYPLRARLDVNKDICFHPDLISEEDR